VKKEKLKKLLNALAFLFPALCIASWVFFRNSLSQLSEDLSESTGGICLVFFCLIMSLFFVFEIAKRKWYPKNLKNPVIFLTRQLNFFHEPLSILGLGFLITHVWFSLSEHGGTSLDFFQGNATTTGYIILVLIVLSVLSGLLVPFQRKIFRALHLCFSFLAVIPLLIHLVD
jgi:hypothetical protein